MPYTAQHKQHSRKRILQAALELFTREGFEKVSIDQLMNAAGMTRGAFYAHFESKSALYAEVILAAAGNSQFAGDKPPDTSNADWLRDLARAYLSRPHLDGTLKPCPLGFLVTDLAPRESMERRSYAHVYHAFVDYVQAHVNKPEAHDTDLRAFAITALLIGGVAIGRALDNEETVEALLAGCIQAVDTLTTSS